jgi:predicted transcriptional regulator
MLPELDSIKKIRTKLGLSQKDLASKCQISASMLNQIERHKAKPSYDTAKMIFEVLERAEFSDQRKAGDICTRNLLTLKLSDQVGDAIKLFSKHGISQVPIMNRNTCLGLISSDDISNQLENNSFDMKTRLSKIPKSMPPIVPVDHPAIKLRTLLSFSKCILVSEDGKIVGIITSEDFHKLLF